MPTKEKKPKPIVLKLKRVQRDLTLNEAARLLGLTRQNYSWYEKKSPNLPIDFVIKHAKILNIDPVALGQELIKERVEMRLAELAELAEAENTTISSACPSKPRKVRESDQQAQD